MKGIISSRIGQRLAWTGGGVALVFGIFAGAVFGNTTLSPGLVAISVVFVVLATTASLLLIFERLLLRRIELLRRTLDNIEQGDFFVRAKVDSGDEIGDIAASLNRVLAKITDLRAESIDNQREMEAVRDELELEQKIAEQSQAIETANYRLSARLSRLTFLYNLGHELTSQLHVDSLLDRFSLLVQEELHVPRFAVMLFDESKGSARIEAWRGFSTSRFEAERALDRSDTLTAQALERKAAVYVPDLAKHETTVIFEGSDEKKGSAFVLPVVYQQRLVGLLHFGSPETGAFDEEERELFAAVANQAALAMANAQLFDRAVELSLTDALTGLPNRRALDRRLEQEWIASRRYGHPLSLVMLDIDRFKAINDEHGHLDGDEVLRRVSHALKQAVRRSDALGRLGGEEFLVILPQTGHEQARGVAEKLRGAVEALPKFQGTAEEVGPITVSCGVATSGADARMAEDLLQAADEKMLQAKSAGRNRVCG